MPNREVPVEASFVRLEHGTRMKSHRLEREESWRVEMTFSGVRILTRRAIIVSACGRPRAAIVQNLCNIA
jgi:hypothetical protein